MVDHDCQNSGIENYWTAVLQYANEFGVFALTCKLAPTEVAEATDFETGLPLLLDSPTNGENISKHLLRKRSRWRILSSHSSTKQARSSFCTTSTGPGVAFSLRSTRDNCCFFGMKITTQEFPATTSPSDRASNVFALAKTIFDFRGIS